jgi:hypothetical protein
VQDIAVGCRAGRMISISKRPDPGGFVEPHGAVYDFAVHGAEATLVPPETTVDMIVQP